MELIDSTRLSAKSLLHAALPQGHVGLPDVCCDLYWWDGRLQLGGPQTVAAVASFGGHDVTIITLDPLVARSWLGVPITHLTDRVVDLADIDKRRASEMTALFEQGRLGELTTRPTILRPRDSRLGIATAALRTGARVRDIARHVDLSERQFERLFFAQTGLLPKRFAGILRLRRAVMGIKRGLSLASAALGAGYADQAHFNRDVRRLSGLSPKILIPNVGNVQDLVAGNWE